MARHRSGTAVVESGGELNQNLEIQTLGNYIGLIFFRCLGLAWESYFLTVFLFFKEKLVFFKKIGIS
jgi:hypothetical protein